MPVEHINIFRVSVLKEEEGEVVHRLLHLHQGLEGVGFTKPVGVGGYFSGLVHPVVLFSSPLFPGEYRENIILVWDKLLNKGTDHSDQILVFLSFYIKCR